MERLNQYNHINVNRQVMYWRSVGSPSTKNRQVIYRRSVGSASTKNRQVIYRRSMGSASTKNRQVIYRRSVGSASTKNRQVINWRSVGSASTKNKTHCHDITRILLKRREQVTYRWDDDDDICFVLEQQEKHSWVFIVQAH